MTASSWTGPTGPRAASDEAYEQAERAYMNAMKARVAGEDASEYSEAAREHSDRFTEAMKVAIPDRPSRGWIGLMCRGLGDLMDVPMPTRDEFPDARRYRVLPYLSILVPISFILILALLFPWSTLSPITATGRMIGGEGGQIVAGQVVMLALAAVVIGFFIVAGPKRVKHFLFEAALGEELWFRLGAENWSPWRRVRACIQFGIAHFLNLIVAIATLGGLALVGGIFMWVYLREIRESGDPRRATIVSAHFHATYNWGAVMLLFVGALLALASHILPLVL